MEEFGVYSGRWREREPRLHPSWHTNLGQRVFAAMPFDGVHPEYKEALDMHMQGAEPAGFRAYLENIGGKAKTE